MNELYLAKTHMPWFILVGRPEELSRAVLMGAGWVINLVVAECIIRSARNRRELSAAQAVFTSKGLGNVRREVQRAG